VSTDRRALTAHGWGRAAIVAAALLLVLAVTGALAAIFYRPYGPDVRAQLGHGHWALRVALAAGLHHVHRYAGLALGLVVASLVALGWRRSSDGPRRGALLAMALGAAAFLTTGLVAPWERLLPWSSGAGSNMARPMALGQQGPFAELIGVNVRYDDAQFTVLRRRFGRKATGRVYLTHVLILPALTVIVATFAWRPRRRERDRR
jgi:hypothetical protein